MIEKKIQTYKKKINKLIDNEKYDSALYMVSFVSEILYKYNQYYTDDFLENCIVKICKSIDVNKTVSSSDVESNGDIIFYDGFGLDNRGLAGIYLSALQEKGYTIHYFVPENRINQISKIHDIINISGGRVYSVPCYGKIQKAKELYERMDKIPATKAFFYTTPWDAFGNIVFHLLKGRMSRFLINLTDHAFWLGLGAFDYCIEFRDYGAYISHHYRKISKEQIILQPYYPEINEDAEFQGYPFEKRQNNFVVFSGGALYKTISEDRLYYRVIHQILQKQKDVIFWYAGQGDDSNIVKLIKDFPGRVYHTGERKDLYQVMKHCDLYLNTYPMVGGLMMQYAATAEKIPITLKHGDDGNGILLNQNELGIEFETVDALIKEVERLVADSAYLIQRGKTLKEAVISKDAFDENLYRIINTYSSRFCLKFQPVDTEAFLKDYKTRFSKKDVILTIAQKRNLPLFKLFPFSFVKGISIKLFKKHTGR